MESLVGRRRVAVQGLLDKGRKPRIARGLGWPGRPKINARKVRKRGAEWGAAATAAGRDQMEVFIGELFFPVEIPSIYSGPWPLDGIGERTEARDEQELPGTCGKAGGTVESR